MSLEAQVQAATKVYQKLQNDLSKAVESSQRLDAQKNENEGVKKEFASLLPTNQIYKMVGPVLLKQDQGEAKANVEHRLELISSETKRVEAQITDLTTKLESKKMEIVHLQTQLEQQQQTGGSGTGQKAVQSVGA